MENVNECTCTSAYWCHDENQMEPGYTCMNCRLEEEAYYQECMEKESIMPISSSTTVTVEVDDDLPF